jgi:predicted CoA-binding protein
MEQWLEIPDELRRRILAARSIAIWPIDQNPLSDSAQTAQFFVDLGWVVYPIHDQCERVLDENCYRDIRLIPDDYDILLLFAYPEQLPDVVNAVFDADYQPPIVWSHTGIFDQQSFDRLTEAGILTIMDSNLMEVFKELLEERPQVQGE